MELYLVQHGEAKAAAEDPERPLTRRGAEATEAMAAWAARTGLRVAEIRHSGKRRAAETAEIFAAHLKPSRGAVAVAGLKPKDDVRAVADELGSLADPVMLIGHLPFLARLAGLLVAGDPEATVVRFRNSGVICLVRDEGRWAVDWLVTPHLGAPH